MLKPFFVWKDRKLIRLDPIDVKFLNTRKNYTSIVLSNDTYFLVRSSLSNTLKKLPPELFIKTHRSWAVSILYIVNVERDTIRVGEEDVPIAKQYYQEVIAQLNVIE